MTPNTPPAEPVPVVDARIYGSVRREGAWECGASAFVAHETEDLPALAVPDALWESDDFRRAVRARMIALPDGHPASIFEMRDLFAAIFAELAHRAGRVG